MSRVKTLTKTVEYPFAREQVWAALTSPEALAEWLMPNDFRPEVGRRFQFRVDPMLTYEGIADCEVLEVDPPRRLVYTWIARMKNRQPHPPMTLTWTLETVEGGTRLTLEQPGLEHLTLWWRFSTRMGWGRMLKTLLPRVLENVDEDGSFTPGAITKRDYGVSSVPDDFAK